MKKIPLIALIILLFTTFLVSANTDNIVIESTELLNDVLTIKGKINSTYKDFVMISVKDKTTDKEIYVNQIKNKDDGTFEFKILADSFLPRMYEIKVNSNIFPEDILTYDFNFNPSKDNKIKSFYIGRYKGVINGSIIEVTVPDSLNLDGLVAKYDVHEKATVKVNGVVQKSGETRNDFNKTVAYKVIAENKDEKTYNVVLNVKKESNNKTSGGGGGGGISIIKPGGEIKKQIDEIDFMKDYKDISKDHWAYPYFKFFINMGIPMGDESKNLKPDNNIRREEFVKYLVSVFKIESDDDISFKDVNENDWFYPYIKSAYGFGIIKGIDDETFGIGNNITRQDMAVIIYRAAKDVLKDNKKVADPFKDEDSISSYAKEAIHTLKENNIINGFPDGSFGPYNTATKAESIAMLYKLYNLIY